MPGSWGRSGRQTQSTNAASQLEVRVARSLPARSASFEVALCHLRSVRRGRQPRQGRPENSTGQGRRKPDAARGCAPRKPRAPEGRQICLSPALASSSCVAPAGLCSLLPTDPGLRSAPAALTRGYHRVAPTGAARSLARSKSKTLDPCPHCQPKAQLQKAQARDGSARRARSPKMLPGPCRGPRGSTRETWLSLACAAG